MNARLYSALRDVAERPIQPRYRRTSMHRLYEKGFVATAWTLLDGEFWVITPAGRAKLAEMENKNAPV